MIATINLFNTYSGNYEDSEDAVLLKTEFLKASEGIVTDYLGFSPEKKEYRDVLLDGTDKGILYLPARNITKLSALAFDGEEKDASDIILADDRIEYRTGDVFRRLGKRYISVSFTTALKISKFLLTSKWLSFFSCACAGNNIAPDKRQAPIQPKIFLRCILFCSL